MITARAESTSVRALWAGIALVAAITVAHYATPPAAMRVHDVLTRLYYVPIVLVGARCGRRAGTGLALLVALAYFPHLFAHLSGGDPLGEEGLNRSFEIVLWIVVGFLTGHLSDRQREAREAAETARDAAESSAREAREAARGLLEAQEQLRQADRLATLGLLSANLAHEIRNPLASLKGIADTLRQDYPEGHARRELLDILDEEVRRLDGVVESHLAAARPAGAGDHCGVRETAESVRALLDGESRRRGARVEVDVAPADLGVAMPPDLLRQVLINLVLNGLQAAGQGGAVSIRATGDKAGVELSVEDDGPGFPREIEGGEPRRFFTTRPHGTGLGLPIASGIVRSHRGTLTLSNRPEGGARVLVRLPARKAGPATMPEGHDR